MFSLYFYLFLLLLLYIRTTVPLIIRDERWQRTMKWWLSKCFHSYVMHFECVYVCASNFLSFCVEQMRNALSKCWIRFRILQRGIFRIDWNEWIRRGGRAKEDEWERSWVDGKERVWECVAKRGKIKETDFIFLIFDIFIVFFSYFLLDFCYFHNTFVFASTISTERENITFKNGGFLSVYCFYFFFTIGFAIMHCFPFSLLCLLQMI